MFSQMLDIFIRNQKKAGKMLICWLDMPRAASSLSKSNQTFLLKLLETSRAPFRQTPISACVVYFWGSPQWEFERRKTIADLKSVASDNKKLLDELFWVASNSSSHKHISQLEKEKCNVGLQNGSAVWEVQKHMEGCKTEKWVWEGCFNDWSRTKVSIGILMSLIMACPQPGVLDQLMSGFINCQLKPNQVQGLNLSH